MVAFSLEGESKAYTLGFQICHNLAVRPSIWHREHDF
jgi:hypothetical protein